MAIRVAARYKQKKQTEKGNTVYLYSERQVAHRNRKKAERLEKLKTSIKKLRSKIKRDLRSSDPEKLLNALTVGLIDHTYERVGNEASAKGGHFGVTGWRKKHVSFGSDGTFIKYVGKSGVKQKKKITDAGIKKALRDAYEACDDSGSCLFQWEGGKVTPEGVNEYLKEFDITTKDIRGLHANREMEDRLKKARSAGKALSTDKKARQKQLKTEFLKALDETSVAVGHEASTLRSQYLVPGLEETFLKDGTVAGKFGSGGEEGLEEYLQGFFRRHRELKRYAPRKIIEQARARGSQEAQQRGNEIWVFPRFWKLDPEVRDYVMAHEIGHYVQSRAPSSKFMDEAAKAGIDVWDTPNLPFGQFNMDEAFADSFASYHLEGNELHRRYPAWVAVVEAIQR